MIEISWSSYSKHDWWSSELWEVIYVVLFNKLIVICFYSQPCLLYIVSSFSYIIDEEFKNNISITPSHFRTTHLYKSLGHVVQFHLNAPNENVVYLLKYQGKF